MIVNEESRNERVIRIVLGESEADSFYVERKSDVSSALRSKYSDKYYNIKQYYTLLIH
jgi:hypothetical protein